MYAYHEPGIIGMLLNEKTGRWHLVIFLVSPLPGGRTVTNGERYRTKMHHTGGFDDRKSALVEAKTLATQVEMHLTVGLSPKYMKNLAYPDKDILWDGEGIPAITTIIGNEEITEECPFQV